MSDVERWDLTPIYPDREAWAAGLAAIETRIETIKPFAADVGESAERLADCLDLVFTTLKDLHRSSSYASMSYDEDTRDSEAAGLAQRARLVGTGFSEAISFLSPSIQALGEETVELYVESEPRLVPYRHYLHDTLRRADHTRTASEEEIIAAAGLMSDGPYSIYGMLANADIAWPTIALSTGEKVRLDQSGYTKYRAASSRQDRKAAQGAR